MHRAGDDPVEEGDPAVNTGGALGIPHHREEVMPWKKRDILHMADVDMHQLICFPQQGNGIGFLRPLLFLISSETAPVLSNKLM